ncbi:MAG: (Fe-S)-binding protein [Nanoarchaeota archaeon]|nr:(Fe-S)-binding protein [Nanoarchaeota archaeon]
MLDWLKGGKTLYFPGKLTKEELPQIFENYKEIFNKLDINFVLLPKEDTGCGMDELIAGYKKEARKIAKKNFKLFKDNSIDKIITNSPESYYMFKEIYPTLIPEWDIGVEHVTVTILNALKKKGIRKGWLDEAEGEEVTYQDPCYLGRHSGIYEEPREAIQILGGKIKEPKLNRESSICCGACGGVYHNFPKLAKKMAEKRVTQFPAEAKIIIPSDICYLNLKEVTERSTEFSTFVLNKLNDLKI